MIAAVSDVFLSVDGGTDRLRYLVGGSYFDQEGTVIGSGGVTGFGSVLDQLLTGRYATWAVGVSVSYPLGRSTEEAQYARARLSRAQMQQRLKSAEARWLGSACQTA